MLDLWLERWREGRIGWHEAEGSALLRRYWPRLVRGSRVMVPLSGKSVDLLWLASRGLKVTGIEVSELAVRAFFADNDLDYEMRDVKGTSCYACTTAPVRICCGDYLDFHDEPYDALYDRGALVAMAPEQRESYVDHTRSLLTADAYRMVITLSYDQSAVDGPPFSVSDEALLSFWPDMRRVHTRNDIDGGPPKFREAGLEEVREAVWVSA